MDLSQLKYILEVAETGSITHAAKNLFMGQPNLSKSIKDLENELGITIFSRTPKGVIPTTSGKNFIGYARSIVNQMNTLSSMYKDNNNINNNFKISVPKTFYISYIFSDYINKLKTSYNIYFNETNSINVLNDVFHHNADLGIIRYQDVHKSYFEQLCLEKELRCELLWKYNMVVIMNKSHPLADLSTIPYNILRKYKQVVMNDFTPVLSTENTSEIKNAPESSIEVFDRASQCDMLKAVTGSYAWSSPVPFSVLAQHELIQKPCFDVNLYNDVVVYPAHLSVPQVCEEFVKILKKEVLNLKELSSNLIP